MAAETSSGSDEGYGHLTDDRDRGIPDTYRATDEFPTGHECDLEADDLPDDEDAYGWTSHYENNSRERTDPDVTDDVIDQLLNGSVVREAPGSDWDNRYLLQKEVNDYEWTLIVADDGEDSEKERWVMVTVYSNYHGSVGTTNRYFDRLRERRQPNEEDGGPEDDQLRSRRGDD